MLARRALGFESVDNMRSVSRLVSLTLVLTVMAAAAIEVARSQDSDNEQEPRRGFRGGRGGFGERGFGGRGRRGGGRGGFGGGGLLGLLRREETQQELNLTPQQTEKVEALNEQAREQRMELFTSLREADPDADRQAMFEKMRTEMGKLQKANDAEVKGILTPEQYERVEQLSLRSQGVRALGDEKVAAKLNLSADQQNQIGEILESDNQSRRRGFGGRRGGGGDREERRRAREQQRAEMEQKLLAVLNAEQKQQWETMLGPPTTVVADAGEEDRRRDRGRGGRRGRRNRDQAESRQQTAPEGEVVAELTVPASADSGDETKESDTGDKGKLLSFNFRFAPWEVVLRRFAEEAELNLSLDVVPPGTLNYFDRGKYTPTQALDILNGYLLQKGYLLVRRDRALVVVNIDDGIPPNLVPQVSVEDLLNTDKTGKNQLVSIVIPLEGTDATTVSEEVKQMVGPQGKVVAMSNLNRLVITDTGGNLRRIYRLLTGETSGPPKSLQFRAFPLKYISAFDADKIVRDLFGLPARGSANNVSASSSSSRSDRYERFRSFRDRGRDRDRDSRRDSSRSTAANTPSTGDVRLAIDERTNSLLVTTTAQNLRMIDEALKTIDVGEGPGGQFAGAGMNRPQLEVYEVQSADPREVTKTLDALLPGVVVNEDGRARRIHILATPEEHRQIRAIINQLDGAASGQGVAVIHLHRSDPLAVAGTLRSLFGSESDAPTIEADVAGRRLMIRGSAEQLAQIKSLLSQLGEDGTRQAAAETTDRGPIRTISLGGRDSKELIKLLQQFWGATNKNPIRVVVPSAVGPTLRSEEREQSQQSSDEPLEVKPAVIRKPLSQRGAGGDQDLQVSQLVEVSQVAEAPAAGEPSDELFEQLGDLVDETNPDAESSPKETTEDNRVARIGAPIVIAPEGGRLIIASEDQEALNRIENLIAALARATPRKRQWTVFYLRSADAIETSSTLGELFPAGSVATPSMAGDTSLTGSISSLGNSLMDMTGLSSLGAENESLRIIAEPRLNALFVTGPESQIGEIENVLKILDAGELPESMRDRVPRRIELEYSDANQVAAIIRDVFQDYLEKPAAEGGRRGGGNPFAAMLGGGSGNSTPTPGKDLKMTLGVDAQTNAIIVSASEPLFQQVSSMVESIEEAAKDARQVVRVVQIDRATAPLVQQSLGSLFGKITVSTTGTQPGNRASNANNNGGTNQESSSNREGRSDEIRRFFEQRMRERMERGRDGSRGGDRRRGGRERGRRGFSGARGRGNR